MDLNHLHLHVRDLGRSTAFYETHFGFREKVRHGEILFLSNRCGFDLALVPAESVETFPAWFHFGFRQADPAAVRAMHQRMIQAGVPMDRPIVDEADLVSFRCHDPDGYGIEVYWEER